MNKTIATCPACNNTGAIGDRYCSCEAAMALRARIDAHPLLAEVRAKIEHYIGGANGSTVIVHVDGATSVLHDLGDAS